ncbi:cupin domain-containing protein (plasmid) [Streptomyces sp. NBC_01420]|uniref:cupin domain-containing protein n=1 Tax=Streptomyces sp. NBC_01420 TaxID=2903858 RepID=UPI002F91575D
MASPGDVLRLGDDRLTFLTTAAQSGGAYVEVAVDYAPAVIKPPAHYHPKQTERMQVQSGRLNLLLDGELQEYEAGDEFHIPPGAVHSLWNPGPEHTRIVWRTTPAYRTETVFETLWGLTNEGRLRPDGTPRLQMPLLALGFRDEYRVVTGRPFLVDMALCAALAPVSLACGYRSSYRPEQHPEDHVGDHLADRQGAHQSV